jgi:hypothetical protein
MAMARVTAGTARTRGDFTFGMICIGTTMAGVQQQRRLDDAHPAQWVDFPADACGGDDRRICIIVYIQLIVLFNN